MSEEECYEALNGHMHCLIRYHNNDDWVSKLLNIVMQAYKEVEEFFVKFLSWFFPQKWKSTITGYLIDMDTTPTTSKAATPSPAESIVTLAYATSNNNVMSMLVL
jgi:hypothetical protein